MKEFKKAVIATLGFWFGTHIFVAMSKAFDKALDKKIEEANDSDTANKFKNIKGMKGGIDITDIVEGFREKSDLEGDTESKYQGPQQGFGSGDGYGYGSGFGETE